MRPTLDNVNEGMLHDEWEMFYSQSVQVRLENDPDNMSYEEFDRLCESKAGPVVTSWRVD